MLCVFRLTGDRVRAAVLLGVGVALSHRDGAGLGLVGAQSLPLLHQAVLVPQVVLHVGLRKVSHSQILLPSHAVHSEQACASVKSFKVNIYIDCMCCEYLSHRYAV